ncbi:multiple epidermal growth factor-like domains protein 10 [Dreissena polymorpha]|uniref:multiple epidermal growth factor-like domains protein 10 n=1 Tax=Dreissena polymorpha TaxID=45954 RepID=UPI002264F501|nr:multiple epidermal growth factor-like domains protein 10 [Dreissena polymorpha]
MNNFATVIIIFGCVLVWAYADRELIQYLRSSGNEITITNGGDVLLYGNKKWESNRVIDGSIGDAADCSCCAALHRPAWISIDFHKPHSFSQIVVYGRNDASITQSQNLQITIDDGFVTFQQSIDVNTTGVFVLNASESHQIVQSINISSYSNGVSETIMTVCEVKVFQTVNKTTQSSTYGECYANNALNNITFSTLGEICKACAVTDGSQIPWWELDLGDAHLLREFRILGRTDQINSGQSTDLNIYISNKTLKGLIDNSYDNLHCEDTPCTVHFDQPRVARFITVNHPSNYPVITLCEVYIDAGYCPHNKFGDKCSRTCHCTQTCDDLTGYCNTCSPGWMSATCEQACPNGKYGINCLMNCSKQCRKPGVCLNSNGSCMSGCTEGYNYTASPLCDKACDHNHYGSNCNLTCNCNGNDDCNKSTGVCPGQCEKGWKGNSCSEKCDQQRFGQNCSQRCYCADNVMCDHVNGACPGVCQPGWTGKSCSKECEKGLYGQNCSSECHCQDGVDCDHVLGNCSDKLCAPGWLSFDCSQACEYGIYGMNCTGTCHCQHGDQCDHVHGNCSDHQCAAGWTSYDCSQACASGYYGENCSMDCHCDQCHNVNGSCALYSTLCQRGFRLTGEFCTRKYFLSALSGKTY